MADQALDAATEFEADLGQLRGFAGTGFAADDHDRVGGDCRRDFILTTRDGKRLGKADLARHLRQTLFAHGHLFGKSGGSPVRRRWLHSRYFSGRAAFYQVILRFH